MKQETSYRLNRNNRFTTIHCSKCDSPLKVQKGKYDKHLYCTSCYSYQGTLNGISGDCCTKPTLIFAKQIISNGGFQLREMCTNCFTKSSDSIPYSQCQNLNELTFWDIQKSDSIKWLRQQEIDKIKFAVRELRTQKLGIITDNTVDLNFYKTYLNSPEWKIKRKIVLKRDNYICQSCLCNDARDVHHITYRHLGNEPLFELVSVCRECHFAIYKMDKDYDSKKIVHDKLLKTLLRA